MPGADAKKIGKFEAAGRGTIVLNEISEMSPTLQAKLLRVLQEHEISRLGSETAIPVDVRVIAATNRDLVDMVEAGSFRMDLFYRLNVIPLTVPPLRDRADDVPLLVDHFLDTSARKFGRERVTPSPEVLEVMHADGLLPAPPAVSLEGARMSFPADRSSELLSHALC